MNKKILIGISILIILFIVGILLYVYNKKDNKVLDSNNKVLVVYYSATGSTKRISENIAKELNADIFSIEPIEEYTSSDLNYNDDNSRVVKEHNDESLRNIKLKNTKVDNWDNYDTVLIGYPIWWGISSWVVDNFIKENDFTGKTVIPFCTSASSSIGNSDKLLKEMSNGGNWLDGYRFSSNATGSDIKSFIDSIK